MGKIKSFETLETELRQGMTTDPIGTLSAITELRRAIAECEREAVFRAIEKHSWREVGEALGVSKQAAFQRFGMEWVTAATKKLPMSELKKTVKRRLEE